MKKHFYFLFLFFITESAIGQYNLTIVQEGNKSQLMNEPDVYGVNSYPSKSKKINDSTIEYAIENITEPTYLFVLIDKVKHGDTNFMANWNARFWIDPEIKQRTLVINYSNKKVEIKDRIQWEKHVNCLHEWDSIVQLTDKFDRTGNDSAEQNMVSAYIEQHPDSYLSLWFFTHSHSLYIEPKDKRLVLFNKLSSSLQKYSDYKDAIGTLTDRNYPNLGDAFKEFKLTDIKGRVFNSATIKNKWILLHFWSNSCGPCVKEMDAIATYYNTLDTSKIAFISVALDDDKNKWEKSVTTNKIKWTNVWEPNGGYGELCLNYNLQAMPFFVLFDNEKKLVIMQDGADAIATTIKGYLSKVK